MKNNYSNFMTLDEMQNELVKVSSKNDVKKGGIPLCYDETSIYLDEGFGHSLVLGSTGSGKTQTTILPKVYTSILAGESFLIDDNKGEVYEIFEKDLIDNDYKIIKLDLYDFKGNSWNPLALPSKLYKDGEVDKAVKALEKIAYYLFEYTNNKEQDPFWINSSRNLFVGVALYLLENKKEVTINSILNVVSNITIDILSELSDDNIAKSMIKSILTMPSETRGSVIAVFNMALVVYTKYNNLSNFLSNNDFELEDLLNNKVAIFVFNGHERSFISSLVLLFIEQLYFVAERNNKKRISIILDDLDDYINFENLIKFLSGARSNYFELTILVRSLNKLRDVYGEIAFEHIISYFSRMIYLYATDEFTLDYISKLCGDKSNSERLISMTELKLMKTFEAIVLKRRMLPFKTKLLPFYAYPKNK